MALSDRKILEQMKQGNIVIEPFDERNLATSSYDVTLGEWYFREQKTRLSVYNIWDENHTYQVWGTNPERAGLARDLLKNDSSENWIWRGIDPNDRIILVGPGETILGHTQEFIGGRNCITSKMQARSSMGRNFIEVCKCAGWGDVGFFNRWTMEITNNSQLYQIPLVVGRRVAQIIFFDTGLILEKNYAEGGKYQKGNNLEKLTRDWNPTMMLPRLYRDREIKDGQA